MSVLKEMQPERRGLLIGLFYRVGVWMSHTDDEAGDIDDALEMKALERVILSIAKCHDDSAFVQDVARQCVMNKEKWPNWAGHSFDILADCEKAAVILSETVNKKDAADYKETLLHIAETVAAAYGEFGMTMAQDDNILGAFLNKVTRKFGGGTSADDDFMNISPAEQRALERLRVALHLDK